MSRLRVLRGLVVCLCTLPAFAGDARVHAEPLPPGPVACRTDALPGLGAAWARYAAAVAASSRSSRPYSSAASTRSSSNVPGGDGSGGATAEPMAIVAAYEEFARVAAAILGADEETTADLLAPVQSALKSGRRSFVRCAPGTPARDRAAWQLLSAGYSASEIEDIVTGRLQRTEIDHARRLLMSGYGQQRAAEYLEAATLRHGPMREPRVFPAPPSRPAQRSGAPALADAAIGERRQSVPAQTMTVDSDKSHPISGRGAMAAASTATGETEVASSSRDVTVEAGVGTEGLAAAATDVALAMRLPLSRTITPRDIDLASVLGSPDALRLDDLSSALHDERVRPDGLDGRSALTTMVTADIRSSSAVNAVSIARPATAVDSRLRNTIHQYATLYGVDPDLVHAMVDTESRGDQRAVSSRGARGLMQLMPATARMLGVNPHDPLDNLRGGIQYLAGLVRQFGDVSSALIAYNAGPTHAERVRRGEAVLYGETRRYLDRIAGLTGNPGLQFGR